MLVKAAVIIFRGCSDGWHHEATLDGHLSQSGSPLVQDDARDDGHQRSSEIRSCRYNGCIGRHAAVAFCCHFGDLSPSHRCRDADENDFARKACDPRSEQLQMIIPVPFPPASFALRPLPLGRAKKSLAPRPYVPRMSGLRVFTMPVAQCELTVAAPKGITMVEEVVIGGGACLRSKDMRHRPDRPGVITLICQSASP